MPRRRFLQLAGGAGLSASSPTWPKPLVRPGNGFWPNGARAAVSFTYDDGRDSQIDVAALDLEYFGCRGTFFVNPNQYSADARKSEWKLMSRLGHEIGNHTMNHRRDYATPSEFEKVEVATAEQWINENIVFDEERTFAYPYGTTKLLNGTDYSNVLNGVVLAARTGGGPVANAADAKQNPMQIPGQASTYSVKLNERTAHQSIQNINDAVSVRGGWAILIFHDVLENPDLNNPSHTSRSVHREIIKYSSRSENKFWVAPFREVFRYAVLHA